MEIEPGGTLFFENQRSRLVSNSPGTLVNQGTIDFAGDGKILQNGGTAATLRTLRNEPGGRVVKSGGGTDETQIIMEVVHQGAWEVETGDLTFFRKVDFAAPLEAAAGSTVSLRGSSATPSILREGSRLFGGADFVFRTPIEVAAGAVVEITRLQMGLSSKFFGAGGLRVTEEGSWVSGSLEGQAGLEIAPAAIFAVDGTSSILIPSGAGPTITNHGRFEIGGGASINNQGAGTFENAGTMVISEGGRLIDSGTALVMENTGTIIKEAGTATGSAARTRFPATLSHRGIFEVRSGILDLYGDQEFFAPITVEAGAVLRMDGRGTTTFFEGGMVNGEGTLEHRGADLFIPAGVRVPFANYLTPFSGGEVTGGGVFVLTDDSSFTRMVHGGAGVTEIAPGAAIQITPGSFRLFDGRTLHVRGSLEFPGAFSFSATNGMTLRNEGLVVFKDGSTWNHGGGGYLIENSGTIRIEAPPTQRVTFAPDEMTGKGLFDLVSGQLRFSRPVDLTGTVRLASGTRLNGNGLSLGSNSTVSGIGQIDGPVTLKGAVSPGLSIGTLEVAGAATFAASGSLNVELAGGASDLLAVAGTLNLGGMTIVPQLEAGFQPSPGDSWTIARANSIVGSVGLVAQSSAAPGFGYFLSQSGTELILRYSGVDRFQEAIEAATGLSLGVDPDLSTFAQGDLDHDGVRDLTDWAFGGSLGGADPGRSLRVDSVVSVSATTREITIAFPIRSIVSDVTMGLESAASPDGAFQPVLFRPAGTELRNGILFQTGIIEVPISAERNFFRVRVELN